MGNISSLLGGSLEVRKAWMDTPEQQFMDAMENAGIDAPAEIISDGHIHRFNVGSKRDKSGWYVFYGDNKPSAGMAGDWKSGIELKFCAKMERDASPVELMRNTKLMEDARRKRDEEREKSYEINADAVARIWDSTTSAKADHPYLKSKGIQPHGSRVTGDGRLVLPLYTPEGELASLQYIDVMDKKRPKAFHTGAKSGGCLHMLGPADSKIAYLTEGFADAATVVEETGCACYIAYSGSNMEKVAKVMKEFCSYGQIVVVSDNDSHGKGQEYAEKASKAINARLIIPPHAGDINDFRANGGDVKSLLEIKQIQPSTWLVSGSDFCSQPSPIKWLVKGWLQQEALCMIHGESGGGKTFLVLDMVLRIASGIDDWHGHKVKKGNVVYLAGEGHHGLKGRIAGWLQNNKVDAFDFWVSKSGLDLDKTDGLIKTVDALKGLPESPDVIVVDTLHRFLSGDENSAQDAKEMLDSCACLMEEFGCSVVLVHHTGVSESAKNRARGSSAWRGALDIEISIQKGDKEKNLPMEVSQQKSKDAEQSPTLSFNLNSIKIDGWFDEDGDQVTTAILEATQKVGKANNKLKDFSKIIEDCYLEGPKLKNDHGEFYLTRSELHQFLVSNRGLKSEAADQYLKPSAKGKMMDELMKAGKVRKDGELIIVTDKSLMSIFGILGPSRVTG